MTVRGKLHFGRFIGQSLKHLGTFGALFLFAGCATGPQFQHSVATNLEDLGGQTFWVHSPNSALAGTDPGWSVRSGDRFRALATSILEEKGYEQASAKGEEDWGLFLFSLSETEFRRRQISPRLHGGVSRQLGRRSRIGTGVGLGISFSPSSEQITLILEAIESTSQESFWVGWVQGRPSRIFGEDHFEENVRELLQNFP